MANLRRQRLSPSGLQEAPAPRTRRWPWVAGVVAVLLLALAWFEGGEEPLHPIAEDVALPEQGQ
ncbi:hypothetical protein [Porphyrobacter sp. ULC335]|jgi:hypothetical protein|uniref:hypothetical protein n=1 Tax=Porphyrobacter sp. ULC335 TaxID=2854260 RepID=UPI00221E4476|nr:hypothetical protein [Porphyrobacter sp. ULC335]UYV14589.1 hypothetical protein KVF90_10505 [Porphyrobacter sp. ULC335]